VLPDICNIYERLVTVEKISLEIMTDSHILIPHECDKMVFVMLFICLYVYIIWMCTSLAPEQ
jgi:hypothetical protein